MPMPRSTGALPRDEPPPSPDPRPRVRAGADPRPGLADGRNGRRRRRQLRGVFRPCDPDRGLPVQRRRAQRADPDRAAGTRRRHLARAYCGHRTRHPIRAQGAWPLRARARSPVQPQQAADRPLRAQDRRPHPLVAHADGLSCRLADGRSQLLDPRQRLCDAERRGRGAGQFRLARRRAAQPHGPGSVDLRGPCEGPHGDAPEGRSLAPRYLPRDGQPGNHRASAVARGHRDRAAAGPHVRRRPLPGRTGPAQLLGLPVDRFFRAGTALPRNRRRPRIQGDGAELPQGGDRGDPRRGLQPHRRRRRVRSHFQFPRPRQRFVLSAGAGQTALHQRHRHRKRVQHYPPGGAAAGDGQFAVLGRGIPHRRVPLRPRRHAYPWPDRVRQRLSRRDPAGPGAGTGQAHRRTLGHRAGRLPARAVPAPVPGMERPLPRRRARLLARRRAYAAGARESPARQSRDLRPRRALGHRLDQPHHQP